MPALLLFLPALFGLASAGSAATLTVTNTNDSGPGSLRGVIAAANSGDTIAFDSGVFPASGGTAIGLTSGRLAVTKSLTIQGPGAGGVTISDTADGVFGVTGSNAGSVTVRISGLTLANGYGASLTGNGNGGGIYAVQANLTVTGCVFRADSANGGGGAVSVSGSTASLTDCTFTGNTAGAGGAVSVSSSTASLTGCTFTGNTAGVGGAVINSGGTVSLTNCTLVGNTTTAGGFGGGIYNSGTQLTLTNCTLVGNTANSSQSTPGQGGGLYNGGAATVQSCILSGNTAASGSDVFGTVASGGSNLIGDSSGASHGFTGAHDLAGVDPKLDPRGLANNGGPTQTVAVLAGSPAIGGDYNDVTSTDQRGFPRTAPQHTVGAFEYKTSHTHLLWNNADSRVMLWNMDSAGNVQNVTGYGPYTDTYVSNSPANLWHATALATAPDGTSRILWNNADHRVMLWSVDGQGNVLGITGYGPYTDNFVNSSPTNLWSAVGVSVGSDNVTHLLWSNVDHRMMFWDVDAQGNVLGLTGYGPYTDTFVNTNPGNLWNATSLATGPDNISRVVWNNVDHRVMLWGLNGLGGSAVTGITGFGPYTDNSVNTDPGNLWSAVGVSASPDNVTHLLWSNVDHRMMFWDLDSAGNLLGLTGYGPYTDTFVNSSPSNLWDASSLATGPDGVSHVGWNNADHRVMLWGLNGLGGSNVLGITGYGPYTDDYVNNSPANLWSLTALSAGP